MLKLGDYNTLKIVKRVDFGLYLDGGDEGEVLLPKRYVTPQMRLGDDLTVFIYLDQDERVVATTEHPLAKVGEFAYLEVAWTNQYGAFLKWGPMKDLFCPFREQKQRMEQGRSYIVYVMEDTESHRLMATAKVERYMAPLSSPRLGGSPDAKTSLPQLGEVRRGLLRFVWRNGRNHASPNSGYPEAALAGILDCRFGGPHYYFGELFDKPYIGENARELTTADMQKAVRINRRAEVLTIVIVTLIYCL